MTETETKIKFNFFSVILINKDTNNSYAIKVKNNLMKIKEIKEIIVEKLKLHDNKKINYNIFINKFNISCNLYNNLNIIDVLIFFNTDTINVTKNMYDINYINTKNIDAEINNLESIMLNCVNDSNKYFLNELNYENEIKTLVQSELEYNNYLSNLENLNNIHNKNMFNSIDSNDINTSNYVNQNIDNNISTLGDDKCNKEKLQEAIEAYNDKLLKLNNNKIDFNNQLNKLGKLKRLDKQIFKLIKGNKNICNKIFENNIILQKEKKLYDIVFRKEQKLYDELKKDIRIFSNIKNSALYFRKLKIYINKYN